MRRFASARVEWRPLFLPRQQLNSRVLSFGSPSGWRDQMTFCIGRRNFITLLGGAAAPARVAVPNTSWASCTTLVQAFVPQCYPWA